VPASSLRDPPIRNTRAQFAPAFGQRVLLTVDTEEEFDWNGGFSATGYGLDHVGRLAKFQEFCENLGVVPVYLVDWPIATSREAVDILAPAAAAGKAEIGVQLHPWVNPPHEEDVTAHNSYAGNLPYELERAKLMRLRDTISEAFGVNPLIYRAGRYGTGPRTAEILREAGIAIDTSVRSHFDYTAQHGPDYSAHPLEPYWLGTDRALLELPVTTVFWGMLRKQGAAIHRAARNLPKLRGVLTRLSLLERIALTPEGVTLEEAIRAIDIAVDDQLPVIVLSFHSPSLVPGHTPYVRTEQDLDRLYDWLRGVYAYLRTRGVAPTTVGEIMHAVQR
jgi:hypothetical protein